MRFLQVAAALSRMRLPAAVARAAPYHARSRLRAMQRLPTAAVIAASGLRTGQTVPRARNSTPPRRSWPTQGFFASVN